MFYKCNVNKDDLLYGLNATTRHEIWWSKKVDMLGFTAFTGFQVFPACIAAGGTFNHLQSG